MEKYKTPNGNIVSADDLRNQYGGRFDDLVKNGTFVLVEETTEAEKKKSSRYSFHFRRGRYGIHYRNHATNNTWLFGFFRKYS
jgi:hypothetical protein